MFNKSVTFLCLVAAVLFSGTVRPVFAHEGEPDWDIEELRIQTDSGQVSGTLWVPRASDPVPCVLICGGTFSHGRNGEFFRKGVPHRDALKRLAEALEAGGYASFRYDKMGHGQSRPSKAFKGTYSQRGAIVADLIRHLRTRKELGPIITAGESAGAYHVCLAARAGVQADGYLFLGGLCRSGAGMYAYTFGRLVEWAEQSPENMRWAESNTRYELALGRKYQEWFDAAAAGQDSFELIDGDFHVTLHAMERRREELALPPDEMFRHITAPALAIAGDKDANVSPEDALNIVRIITAAGNDRAEAVLIPGVDHSFQNVPADENLRMRERYNFQSLKRSYAPDFYREVLKWLHTNFPTPGAVHLDEIDAIAARITPSEGPTTRPSVSTASAPAGIDIRPVTQYTPERIHLAPGIQIVDDITDSARTAAVDTLEGRIGPLILAADCQAHFLDMPAGMYTSEHPHSKGSIIYTVRGQWVLCGGGKRHLMKPGSLFRFDDNTPTGYEIPFDEDAYILVFKGERLSEDEKTFIEYLRGLKVRLERQHRQGAPFLIKELPPDHPARVFARKINPEWEKRPLR